jgi:glycerol-3-phosphate dehydrogenase
MRPLPGCLDAQDRDQLLARAAHQVDANQAQRWWHLYGGASDTVLDLAASDKALAMAVAPGAHVLVAELVHAIEQERAVSLVDVLARRTMAGLDQDRGLDTAPGAASWLVRLGIWDKHRMERELAAYREHAQEMQPRF